MYDINDIEFECNDEARERYETVSGRVAGRAARVNPGRLGKTTLGQIDIHFIHLFDNRSGPFPLLAPFHGVRRC